MSYELPVNLIEEGTNVYVALGYITVKCGRICGARITYENFSGSPNVKLEYKILWFGADDQSKLAEWFDRRYVFLTSNEAFA